MSAHLDLDRTAGHTAARAIGLALAAVILAAGLHHTTTDSSLSWPALAIAAAVLAACAYPVLRTGASRRNTLVLGAAQALLPAWLEITDTEIPAPALDDHLRLPAAWHHNPFAMAALNFLAALALVYVFRSASGLPARLSYAVAATARRAWDRLLHVIGLVLRLTGTLLPRPPRPPLPAVALPRPRALTVLLYRVQPCAP
ncbi:MULTISPECIES: hypothetical protein [unclassified Streptomyces]|uniref:hypothetical protein n=1 Tax=unclassified Streptomyces TaxID=2593676 RepID=UPI002E812A24|nr:hypothetical protein [Streptomyces sp. NBC_00589]WTI35044.1 hypothetical protein OIC96_08605 [Streptomyces sp. NBC_00775]WUB31282.1 hypothetical protein OHA51_41125 [Streptomyces sp. NBC_00589]